MIRFLDLKNQITEGQHDFAFFNTVPDRIETFGRSNDQVFYSKSEFIKTYTYGVKPEHPLSELQRYLRLIPEDFFTPSLDRINRGRLRRSVIAADVTLDGNETREELQAKREQVHAGCLALQSTDDLGEELNAIVEKREVELAVLLGKIDGVLGSYEWKVTE